MDPDLEDGYRAAQARLMDRHGLRAQSRYVELARPKCRIHLLDGGTGEVVLFLHGGGGMGADWIPLAARIATHRHVVIADRPGHGLSDSFDHEGVDLRRMSVDLVGSILGAMGAKRATLVGGSFGAFMAMSYALAHPERVEGVVALGSFPGVGRSIHPMMRLIVTPIVGGLAAAAFGRPSLEGTRRFYGKLLVAHPERLDPDYVEAATLHSTRNGRDVRSLFRASISPRGWRARYDLADDLRTLRVPSLLVWGERDAMWDAEHILAAASLMRGSRLVRIPDAGHMPWLDALEPCAETLATFLAAPRAPEAQA